MQFRLKVIWAEGSPNKREIGVSVNGDPKDNNFIIECLEEIIRCWKAPGESDPELFPSGKLSFF